LIIRPANLNVPTRSSIAIVKSNCYATSSLNVKNSKFLNYIKGKGNCNFTLIPIESKSFFKDAAIRNKENRDVFFIDALYRLVILTSRISRRPFVMAQLFLPE
jgi:hypothetical protein